MANTPAEHDRILGAVAGLWGVTVEEMKGPRRSNHLAHPRQVAMYLIRKRCQSSFVRVGLLLGNRDHTTVIFGVNRIRAMLAIDGELVKRVALIERDLDRESESSPQVRDTNSGVLVPPAEIPEVD